MESLSSKIEFNRVITKYYLCKANVLIYSLVELVHARFDI